MSKNKKRKRGRVPQAAKPVEATPVVGSGDGGGDAEATHGSGTAPEGLWDKMVSKLMDAYETMTMTLGIGLSAAWMSATFRMPDIVQWIIGITAMLAVVLFRTVFADEVSDIVSEARDQVEEDRKRSMEELEQRDFDGVPEFLQKIFPYPTQEEQENLERERERQRGLLNDHKRKRDSKPASDRQGDQS